MSERTESDISDRLSEQLVGVFEGGASAQRAHYELHPEQRPTANDLGRIIAYYANLNAAISGGLSLIPGPFGMLAAIPEVVLVIRNQVRMVYDIGVACGKDDQVLTRELLLGITMSATGLGTIGLLTMQGGKVLVKRTSLRIFQKIVSLFAGKVTQHVLKAMVAKWLPLLGAGAIAVWTRYSTVLVGRKARELLAGEIVVQVDEEHLLEDRSSRRAAPERAVAERVLLLSNLTKVDGDVSPKEAEYVESTIAGGGLDEAAADALRQRVAEPNQHPVDFAVFDPDERVSVLMDLVALAHRDGTLHPAEVLFLRQVARRFDVPEADLQLLLGGSPVGGTQRSET